MFDNINIQTNTPNNIIEITNNDMESYIKKAESLVGISQQNANKTGALVEQSKTTLNECKKLRDGLKEEIESLGDVHSTMMNNPHNVTAEQVGAYSKEEIDAKSYLTSVPEEYVTETELKNKAYLTSDDISGFATKTELESGLELKQSTLVAGDNITIENNIVSTSFAVADTDLSNLSEVGTKIIDGKWVPKVAILTQSVAAGITEIDMSEYLPQDDCQYEVLMICGYYKSSVANIKIYSDVVPQPSSVSLTVASSGSVQSSYIYIPIGIERKLYQYLSSATTSSDSGRYGIEALAYRRIGKNQ